MCSACEQGISDDDPVRIQQWDDQEQAWLRETIRQHGWAIQAVSAEPARRQPPFAYTVGLTRFGHPELVVFGLPESASGALLNTLGIRARSGLRIADGTRFDPGAAAPYALRVSRLPNPEQVLLTAVRRYGPRVTAMQVIVADEHGTFPGEGGYRGAAWLQPLPGSFAA
jgi:hypothetical protein